MSEYTSCHWLQHGISFENDHLEMCCLCCHKGGGRLYIKENYKGKGISWDEIFELKEQFIQENRDGIINPKCEGCFNLTNKNWDDDEKYINYIHFNHWSQCNSNCIYCYTSWDKDYYQKRPFYKVVPIIKELFKKKLFKPNGEITFAGGESTILPEFERLINLLIKNDAKRITVHSSGIKYSKAIEYGIREKRLSVCLSADAGTREMYKRIKRVDKFNDFWQNVYKYAQAQRNSENRIYVETKFLLIPGVNTYVNEIERWLELSLKAGVGTVVADIENDYCRNLEAKNQQKPQYLVYLCKYIEKRTRELGLKLVDYNNFRYLVNEYNLVNV